MEKKERSELEKDLYKIWNNWLSESDYHLFIKYGVRNGRDEVKDFIYHVLDKEARSGKYTWILPF